MRERPILFNGAMVRAILAGQKTQTRRVVKGHALVWLGKAQFTPEYVASPGNDLCPFGQPGDRLWVRESFTDLRGTGIEHRPNIDGPIQRYAYSADTLPGSAGDYARKDYGIKWRPSIHMPRAACRLVLEITAVRVERLHEISESDAIAEGADENVLADIRLPRTHARAGLPMVYADCREVFADLWDTTGGDWDSNPWVWVIEFKREEVAGG